MAAKKDDFIVAIIKSSVRATAASTSNFGGIDTVLATVSNDNLLSHVFYFFCCL